MFFFQVLYLTVEHKAKARQFIEPNDAIKVVTTFEQSK